ncbi:hypothetical protein D3C87_1677230 [compost metagenome]
MPVKVPGVMGPAFSPSGTRSAPCTSLVSTLPLRVSRVSEAVDALLSSTPFGKSSTMLTLICPVALSPSLSVATTLKFSVRLLAPLAVGCASLSFRV